MPRRYKKSVWHDREKIKYMSHLSITFEDNKETISFILSAFPKMKRKCIYCHKAINTNNLGGILKQGFMCKNIVCIVQYIESQKLLK